MDAFEFLQLQIIFFALIFEGALGSVQDACRGYCDDMTGYFCEPFNGICEPCKHCIVQDRNGCRQICDAWSTGTTGTSTAPNTSGVLYPTPDIEMTLGKVLTDISKGITPAGGTRTDSGSPGSNGTEVPELSTGLVFGLLGALAICGIVCYFCCFKRTHKDRGQQEEDVEMELVPAEPHQRGPAQRKAPVLPQPASGLEPGEEEAPLSYPTRPARQGTLPVSVRDNGKKSGLIESLLSQQEEGRGAESGYKSADFSPASLPVQPRPTMQASRDFLSRISSLHSSDSHGLKTEVEQHQGAVPFSRNPGEETALSTTVQDGSHDRHEYALNESQFHPFVGACKKQPGDGD